MFITKRLPRDVDKQGGITVLQQLVTVAFSLCGAVVIFGFRIQRATCRHRGPATRRNGDA